MGETNEIYRVGLLLNEPINEVSFNVVVATFPYQVVFVNITDADKYCDLVIVSKNVRELESLPKTFTDTHTSPIILNTKPTPSNEHAYDQVFTKSYCRFKKLNSINKNSIELLIKQEIIKSLARENSIHDMGIVTSKFTRKDFFREIRRSEWFYFTVIPVLCLIAHSFIQFLLAKQNIQWSILCTIRGWTSQYDPDCFNSNLDNLKFFALFFTLCNLISYSIYIFGITREINNDIFINEKKRIFSRLSFFFACLIFILSLFTVLSSSLIFLFEDYIFKANNLNKIEKIIDLKSQFLNGNYLIYYFIVIDVLLFFYVKNVLTSDKDTYYEYLSSRQRKSTKDAKVNFFISICWGLAIVINTHFLSVTISNIDNIIIVQLFTLQIVYIYLNISSSLSKYKYN